MEDILASIKRIIADESAPAPRVRPVSVRAVEDAVTPLRPVESDVLELDQPIKSPPPPSTTTPPPPSAKPAPRQPAAAETPPPLVSESAAEASRQALEALSRLIVSQPHENDRTLEGVVREMLRPMLREWLDARLPDIVEGLVSREIARITGRL